MSATPAKRTSGRTTPSKGSTASRGSKASEGGKGSTSSKSSTASSKRRGTPAHRAGREDAPKKQRAPRVEPVVPDAPSAHRLVTASWIGTGLLTVTAVAASIDPDLFAVAAVIVALGLFLVGVVAFAWAYLVAISRSREDLIGMGGLFFLAGSAPRPVQRQMLASFVLQIVVALGTASVWLVAGSHFSKSTVNPLAFGLLAPMYGLGLMGLWAARFGTFPPRPPDPQRPSRRKRAGSDAGADPAPDADTGEDG